MSCPCNQTLFPKALDIAAGLDSIPRQIASFPEWRSCMVSMIRGKGPLRAWRGREPGDIGLMLLEMGAYVFDVLSFYDEVIAHEAYLRTARLRPSLRKLVGLLGYRPRPAVGAYVDLAAFAQGHKPVKLPSGTAFRSGAFDGEAPQVFELESAVTIHPLENNWNVKRPRRKTVGSRKSSESETQLLLHPDTARLESGDAVLIDSGTRANPWVRIRKVEDTASIVGKDGERYVQVNFNAAVIPPADASISAIRIRKPTSTAYLRSHEKFDIKPAPKGETSEFQFYYRDRYARLDLREDAKSPIEEALERARAQAASEAVASANAAAAAQGLMLSPEEIEAIENEVKEAFYVGDQLGKIITLDGLYPQIRVGQQIILEKDGEYRWYEVIGSDIIKEYSTEEIPMDEGIFKVPSLVGPYTQLTLDADINTKSRSSLNELQASLWQSWTKRDLMKTTAFYHLIDAGKITVEANTQLCYDDSMELEDAPEAREGGLGQRLLLFQDSNELGIAARGAIDYEAGEIDLESEPRWETALKFPVEVFGNVITVSRGESVIGEILGSGDATIANQSFKLKKKPLTYLPSPTQDNDSGVASTLEVHVDGVRWSEMSSFFRVVEDTQVYIVRQDDEGESFVTFGDGRRGARLPTGTDNVIANYRYGAGTASPPAGSISQIAKPVKGLTSVTNPLAAGGGEDAEAMDEMRMCAPESALILGRAVSIQDMEAVATQVPGVRVARAEWRWSGRKQRPVARIWFIGGAQPDTVSKRLRSVSDPSTPIDVQPATGLKSKLLLVVGVDPRYLVSKVIGAVESLLMDKVNGLLIPEKLGIGKLLYRSRIFDTVLSAPGAIAVRDIRLNGHAVQEYAVTPGARPYFHSSKRQSPPSVVTVRDIQNSRYYPRDDIAAAQGAGCYFDFEAGSVKIEEGAEARE